MGARMRSHTGGHSSPTLICRDGWSIGRRLTSPIREHSTAARSAATSTIPRGKERRRQILDASLKPQEDDAYQAKVMARLDDVLDLGGARRAGRSWALSRSRSAIQS